MSGLRIGEVARRSGVAATAIRYYERVGLFPPASRSQAGYRVYTERTVDELLFVKRAQRLGFTLDEIREIVGLSRNGTAPCSRVLAVAETHLSSVENRIRQLKAFHKQLGSAIARWRRGRCGFMPGGLCDLVDAVSADPRHPGRSLPNHTTPRTNDRRPSRH